jgi:23S rRNA (pseudouridine1915-N3)-methyltransferase
LTAQNFVKIKVAWIGKTKEPAIEALTSEYLKRISHYADIEGVAFKDESGVLSLASGAGHKNQNQNKNKSAHKTKNKDRHKLVLLDTQGKQLSSEELAQFLEREQLHALPLLFAIGGSDGFSDDARRLAGFSLSLGKMTLPHELARIVLLEQLYRAFTILKKHPYHLGH